MKKTISLVLVLLLGLATEVANADFIWGTHTELEPIVQSGSDDAGPSLSADGLSLFFFSNRPGGYGGYDLWVTTRASISEPWETPVNLSPTINSSAHETEPSISADGLLLYFADGVHFQSVPRPGGFGQSDIWVVSRATTSDPWDAPVNLGPNVNTGAKEGGPTTTSDGLVLIFDSDRSGGRGHDLWMSTRPTVYDPWSAPVNLGPTVNSSAIDAEPSVSPNGLMLFFMSNRTGGAYGDYKIWVTTRPSISDDFGTPVDLGSPINSSAIDATPGIAPNGLTLLFMTERATSHNAGDIWQVSIAPVVDFNGDGIVDSADMCIMVDHWGENYPLCDIGPMPWGDGIVDVQDLIVLAEHLFEEPGLIAYWKLDETEGDIAYDSANDNDDTVYGDPAWQPEGGMVDGALQLDGIDDYVNTDYVLNPAEGPFSVLVWIKGGAPGQAVLSQIGGANWILADASEGKLMTELKGTGRGAAALLSQTIITDGDWHRIGLVWDGSHRMLYVDDVAVAENTQPNLEGFYTGLYIGTGTAMEPGSFWSGLIDDVRIYNRAVIP